MKLAYENVKEVDCLDTTKDGNEQWEDAMKRYEQRIDQVCWTAFVIFFTSTHISILHNRKNIEQFAIHFYHQ